MREPNQNKSKIKTKKKRFLASKIKKKNHLQQQQVLLLLLLLHFSLSRSTTTSTTLFIMSTEEEDYSNLSLEERFVHKVWKVRLQAYEELATNIENSRNELDPIFTSLSLDNLKKMILDSNVVAQETGYNTFNKFLIFGGNAANVSKLKNLGIIGSICEKGLLSSRKNTKEWSVESILLMIEISNDPNSIVEDILPYLTNRLPKLVTGCVSCLAVNN